MPPHDTPPPEEHDARLLAAVRPAEWRNPTPRGRYNLAAIGAGAAGLVSTAATAGLGGAAALVEERRLGGDCLNYGCVPSKALLRAARAAYDAQHAAEFGVRSTSAIGDGSAAVDFAAVMERMRRLRADISRHDAAARFAGLGVDVFFGSAEFTGPETLVVAGQTVRFSRCVIAAGSRPAMPPIEGLREAAPLTNETIFSLDELPPRLVVLGAGPVGCELAQALRRFGSAVTLINRSPRVLGRDTAAAATLVEQQLRQEGVGLHLGATIERVERRGREVTVRYIDARGAAQVVTADALLVALGRTPNVERLALEAAGVTVDERGVVVDDYLRTANRRIYAAGDIAGRAQFTHAADAMARLCVQNALFFPSGRYSRLLIPHVTYTDPEVAQVGLTPELAAERGLPLDTYRVDLADVDRAVLDGDAGFAAVYCRRGTARVVGATIVARHAGELLAPLVLLMTRRWPLSALAGVVLPYPTQAEALKRLADRYQRTRLRPWLARALRTWLAWRR